MAHPHSTMNDLIAMGFDEASAQTALRRTNGNIDQAVDFLLSSPRGGFPRPAADRQVCSGHTVGILLIQTHMTSLIHLLRIMRNLPEVGFWCHLAFRSTLSGNPERPLVQ